MIGKVGETYRNVGQIVLSRGRVQPLLNIDAVDSDLFVPSWVESETRSTLHMMQEAVCVAGVLDAHIMNSEQRCRIS